MSTSIPGTNCQIRPTKNFRVATGRHLRSIRVAHGESQRDFAGRLGISSEALSKYESGRASPTLRGAWQMAYRMGVPVDALLPELPWDTAPEGDRFLYTAFRRLWARPVTERELIARLLDVLLQFLRLHDRPPLQVGSRRAYAPRS